MNKLAAVGLKLHLGDLGVGVLHVDADMAQVLLHCRLRRHRLVLLAGQRLDLALQVRLYAR